MTTIADIIGEKPLATKISYDTSPTAVKVPVDVKGPAMIVIPIPSSNNVNQAGAFAASMKVAILSDNPKEVSTSLAATAKNISAPIVVNLGIDLVIKLNKSLVFLGICFHPKIIEIKIINVGIQTTISILSKPASPIELVLSRKVATGPIVKTKGRMAPK